MPQLLLPRQSRMSCSALLLNARCQLVFKHSLGVPVRWPLKSLVKPASQPASQTPWERLISQHGKKLPRADSVWECQG